MLPGTWEHWGSYSQKGICRVIPHSGEFHFVVCLRADFTFSLLTVRFSLFRCFSFFPPLCAHMFTWLQFLKPCGNVSFLKSLKCQFLWNAFSFVFTAFHLKIYNFTMSWSPKPQALHKSCPNSPILHTALIS